MGMMIVRMFCLKCFQLEFVDYGQLVKIREHGCVVRKVKMVVYGVPSLEDVETTDVENLECSPIDNFT